MDHAKLIDLFEAVGVLLNVYYTPVAFVDKEAIDTDQSPESQPTYDFIVPWANNPALTSTSIAIGAFIVVASMGIARVLLSQKREERKQFVGFHITQDVSHKESDR